MGNGPPVDLWEEYFALHASIGAGQDQVEIVLVVTLTAVTFPAIKAGIENSSMFRERGQVDFVSSTLP